MHKREPVSLKEVCACRIQDIAAWLSATMTRCRRLLSLRCLPCLLPQARTVAEPIIATVSLMAGSGLPCFSRGAPVANLRNRFHLEMNDAQVCVCVWQEVPCVCARLHGWLVAGWRLLANCRMQGVMSQVQQPHTESDWGRCTCSGLSNRVAVYCRLQPS